MQTNLQAAGDTDTHNLQKRYVFINKCLTMVHNVSCKLLYRFGGGGALQ